MNRGCWGPGLRGGCGCSPLPALGACDQPPAGAPPPGGSWMWSGVPPYPTVVLSLPDWWLQSFNRSSVKLVSLPCQAGRTGGFAPRERQLGPL